MTEEVEPHIHKFFDLKQKLGKGAYGIVWRAIDKKTQQEVALKKVFNAFQNDTDAQRTYREVMFLQELSGHQNIIRLLHILRAQNDKDIYLVFDYMETDLHHIIRAGVLEQLHRRYIAYQIFKALKYIHSGQLIHRDLKPSNILINPECQIKIADFGLARSVNQKTEEEPPVLTECVATRWYRAPEVLLGSKKYTTQADMWSTGCILAQLVMGKALFPGEHNLDQIQRIVEMLGKPSKKDIASLQCKIAANIMSNVDCKKKRSFEELFYNASFELIDLIKKLLVFNPSNRLSAEQCLKHPYVRAFHNSKEQVDFGRPINIPICQNTKLSLQEYRESLYADITQRKKDQKRKEQEKYLKRLGIDPSQIFCSQEEEKAELTWLTKREEESQSELFSPATTKKSRRDTMENTRMMTTLRKEQEQVVKQVEENEEPLDD